MPEANQSVDEEGINIQEGNSPYFIHVKKKNKRDYLNFKACLLILILFSRVIENRHHDSLLVLEEFY